MYFPSGNLPVGQPAAMPAAQLTGALAVFQVTVLTSERLSAAAAAQLPTETRVGLPRLDGASGPPEPHLVSVNRGRDTLLLLTGSHVPPRSQLQLAGSADGGWQVRQVLLPAPPHSTPARPPSTQPQAQPPSPPQAQQRTASSPGPSPTASLSAHRHSLTSSALGHASAQRAPAGAATTAVRAVVPAPEGERLAVHPSTPPGADEARSAVLARLRQWLPRAPAARELLAQAPPRALLEQTAIARLELWRGQSAQLAAALLAERGAEPQAWPRQGPELPELKGWLDQVQARFESTRAQQQLQWLDSPLELALPLFSETLYLTANGRLRLLRSRARRATDEGGKRWQLTAEIELGEEQSLVVDLEWILEASATAGQLWARLWSDTPPLRAALTREVNDLQAYLSGLGITAQVTVERVALPPPPPPANLVELSV